MLNNLKKKNNWLYLPILLLLASCSKEDILTPLPPQPPPQVINTDKLKKSSVISSESVINQENNLGWYSSHLSNTPNKDVAVGIAYFDFNGDTDVDMLLKNENTGEFEFWIKKGNSYTKEDYTKGISIQLKGTRRIVTTDINNDKYVDFVLALADDNDTTQRGLYFLKGDKDGFELIKYSNASKDFYHGVTTGDVNKDGNVDIIISGPTFFLMGNGDFTFTKTNWPSNLLERGPAHLGDYFGSACMDLIDLNKDGYLDLIRGFHNNQYDQPGKLYGKSIVINFGQNGYPYFGEKQYLETIEPNSNITLDFAFYDFDKDGDVDIFSNSNFDYTGEYYIQYYENKGGTQFENKTTAVFENESYKVLKHYAIDWIKLADWDKDGTPELLIEGKNHRKENGAWVEPNFNSFKVGQNGKFYRYKF
jgi:hypothetical protein